MVPTVTYPRNICRLFAAILLLLLGSSSCLAQRADSAKVIAGLHRCWRAFSHDYTTIYGLEEEEVKAYSKQKLCFTPDSFSMYYGTRYTPRYSIKKVNANTYAKSNFDGNAQKMGIIVDSVYEITISSLTRPPTGEPRKMTDVIAWDGTCTYVVVDGVIFKLVDADSKVQPRSSQ